MNKEQANIIKAQIKERREYLKALDVPLVYSKTNLYGGMQARVGRQEDRIFKGKVVKQRGVMKKHAMTVDEYLSNLNTYNDALSSYDDMPQIPGGISTISAPVAPVAPEFIMPPMPKMSRPIRRGIGGRRY